MRGRVLIETYGCTLNQADSELMGGLLERSGYQVEHGRYAHGDIYDYVIVNTCTVKRPTEQKILSRLGKMAGLKNRLIVAGCMASANKELISSAVSEASILTTNNVARVADAIAEIESGKRVVYDGKAVTDKMSFYGAQGSVIAKIPVSEGCLSSCSFCETKFARGPLNSFSQDLILKAVEMSVKKGAREIELTSQDMGAYGLDKRTNVAELASRAANIEGEFKIRIGMLNPEHLHKYLDQLIEAYRSEKLYKFIHLPVQAGSNKVLGEMKRRYTREEFINYASELREKVPGISIETDVIVGYPTETKQDFEESLELVGEVKPTVTNVSKFSTRQHARASRLRQLPSEEVKRRSIEMSRFARALQDRERRKLVGSERVVLITERNARSFAGRDDGYIAVALREKDGLKVGDFVNTRITASTMAYLTGEVAS